MHILNCLGESDVSVQYKPIRLPLAKEKVRLSLKAAYDKNVKNYNLRSRNRQFSIGQKVLVKSFSQSDAIKNYNGKLDKQSLPALISKAVGNVAFECVTENGKILGVYHIKDIFNR